MKPPDVKEDFPWDLRRERAHTVLATDCVDHALLACDGATLQICETGDLDIDPYAASNKEAAASDTAAATPAAAFFP